MSQPEIANSINTGGYATNYHDQGEGFPVLLIHGSGPGVTAWANWRLVIPVWAKDRRVIAPDMVGFGYTERPDGVTFSMDTWVKQTVDLMDALDIPQADFVGNSFGGGLAIAMATRYPERVRNLVLMGSMGIIFDLPKGLNDVWGYTPSVENMSKMIDSFIYNKAINSADLAEMRYKASIEPGFQESFSSMFPEPRTKGIAEMATDEALIKQIAHKTLIVHGREDEIIPVENAYRLINLIDDARLHIFGHCGHWTQIEKSAEFATLVSGFLG